MHAKIINGVVEKYPYSIGELRKDNPNTSFPKTMSDEVLAQWNVIRVEETAHPEVDHTKNFQEGPIVNDNGWKQTWVITDATAAEIAERTSSRANAIRAERDQKLAECDWLVIKAYETNTNIPGVWEAYRQTLRDIPAQAGFPWNVTWPAKPE